jgi:hypothetical protein
LCHLLSQAAASSGTPHQPACSACCRSLGHCALHQLLLRRVRLPCLRHQNPAGKRGGSDTVGGVSSHTCYPVLNCAQARMQSARHSSLVY